MGGTSLHPTQAHPSPSSIYALRTPTEEVACVEADADALLVVDTRNDRRYLLECAPDRRIFVCAARAMASEKVAQ